MDRKKTMFIFAKKYKFFVFAKEKITELGITQSSIQVEAPAINEETRYIDDDENLVSQEIIGGADEPTSIYLESSSDSDSSETE